MEFRSSFPSTVSVSALLHGNLSLPSLPSPPSPFSGAPLPAVSFRPPSPHTFVILLASRSRGTSLAEKERQNLRDGVKVLREKRKLSLMAVFLERNT